MQPPVPSLAMELHQIALATYEQQVDTIIETCKSEAAKGNLHLIHIKLAPGAIELLKLHGFKVKDIADFDENKIKHTISW